MKKEDIFRLFMEADYNDFLPLAKELKSEIAYEVIKQPEPGLVMFRAEETVEKLDFNVGEILMTTAEVKINNTLGYSMIMGMNNDKALDGALIMAVYEAIPEKKSQIEETALKLKKIKELQLREEREIISSTRVHFEVMGGQDPNVKKYHEAQGKEEI